MRTLLATVLGIGCFSLSLAQGPGLRVKKYPSLLWEIRGGPHSRPSYLFGTMHVSSKMVFHLSDSFYLGLKNAEVVALETNPGNWQDDFSRYDLEGSSVNSGDGRQHHEPEDYLSINTLKAFPYEKLLEVALYSNPSIINSFLYRSNSETTSDFEEDTYLDMYIYQVGRKWKKKMCGVENFDQSMSLMKQAYADASRDRNIHERSYDGDNDFSYGKLEEAYRTGDLDLLDTINKVNSTSRAFDEKFLYRRNEIQAASIDSILQSGVTLFVGVGAAHLPGERGVIEILRKKGYHLRPIKMTERDSRHKDSIEGIRVPVKFERQMAADSFFSVKVPGKLYSFTKPSPLLNQQQYADMSNGSYYMVSRIYTNAALWGAGTETVLHKIDSVLYENIPGKILSRRPVMRDGYPGLDIINRTRRGDYQRYNIFVTPYEVLLFKMSGNGEYVTSGQEADEFFHSIAFREYPTHWMTYSPSFGGFGVDLPHPPFVNGEGNWKFLAYDAATATNFEVIRTDVHNTGFVEEDSFDLDLMEESFGASSFIEKQLSRKHVLQDGHAALETQYRYKDGSVALARFVIQGPHYYTLLANARNENAAMRRFIHSFHLQPFSYPRPLVQRDTSLLYTVSPPIPLQKKGKLELYPRDLSGEASGPGGEDIPEDLGSFKDQLITCEATGEKVYVSLFRPSRYHSGPDTAFSSRKMEEQDWVIRNRKGLVLPNGFKVVEYTCGSEKSSRVLRGKLFTRDGVRYRLVAMGDTLGTWSPFIEGFFSSFQPDDQMMDPDGKRKPSDVFFADFFGADTLRHQRALQSIHGLIVDTSDFLRMKKALAFLGWKDKNYLEAKTSLLYKISTIATPAATDFLKEQYYTAGDTLDFQYTALEALLNQKTSYAFRQFGDIMVNDPPVLGLSTHTGSGYRPGAAVTDEEDDNDGSFLKKLKDSLLLTKTIFRDLLPLINIRDYEKPVLDLLETLVDSNKLTGRDYELYFSKFLLEAKQELKKQVISEKNRSIEKARSEKVEGGFQETGGGDQGNQTLMTYATLLMPFFDKNPAVPPLLKQMLGSQDQLLQYNTLLLMLRHQKPVSDSLLAFFARQDAFRYNLYRDLKSINELSLFPSSYKNQVDLARSRLMNLNSYPTPDSLSFLGQLPLQYGDWRGKVYFFKYKDKKEERNWKIAMAGLLPSSSGEMEFNGTDAAAETDLTDLTETKLIEGSPLGAQLQKVLKRKLYSKRKSGLQFYDDENGFRQLHSVINFRD
ncbi:MAG: TraB/GumN family protein [Flavisolibacter sp.]